MNQSTPLASNTAVLRSAPARSPGSG
ncbi:hypothetical protein ETD86_04540 [Nonomuraea turkmeniaca]|uniref:Uncharacterized protein n=1 Tax=Nonomuraea turkmeniaca TaxID=103838 RepID=A0A5S4FUX8_9ACTN|nr:hypothetical protein ETD86_04540 [Nonomuraea turkmeniaca]